LQQTIGLTEPLGFCRLQHREREEQLQGWVGGHGKKRSCEAEARRSRAGDGEIASEPLTPLPPPHSPQVLLPRWPRPGASGARHRQPCVQRPGFA
jgi:hypothetical protein